MHIGMSDLFINIDLAVAIQVILLGFIGGTLSGFIGSGGAFFMTPGMMNLGVQGVIAVGSNITHKFGKAMVGARKHREMGNVDRKLALFLVLTSFAGIRLAVWINSRLFAMKGEHGEAEGAAANLYISLVFVFVLSLVAVSMLRDAWKTRKEGVGPSRRISEFLSRMQLKPLVYFKVADVKVSIWMLLLVGLATGYLAGTIGVGGFIGVPAMIYVFGIPTAVAAGTELYLAMFMGAWGALNYAWEGFVDIRLTMLMYLGSLLGVFIGTYGVKVVNEVYIRLVTGLVIIICAFSRFVAVPMYLRQLELLSMNPALDTYFNSASSFLLFAAGFGGVGVILFNVLRAHRRRRSLQVVMEYTRI
jgi:uncharacterized membrane protein YfcA